MKTATRKSARKPAAPPQPLVSPAQLSCDPVYRGMVQAARQDAAALAILNDYREERQLPRLHTGLAPTEKLRPGFACHQAAAVMAQQNLAELEKLERALAFQAKNSGLAVTVGMAYHKCIGKLYTSAHGTVLYGRGGQETTDWDRYSKKYHRSHGPARNLNGGARIEGSGKTARIVLQNHRGTEVARLPLPPAGAILSQWLQEVV